ncbi:hypothetical protein FEV53_00885 [Palleronia caenipelagi]|uniref:DUF2946 domain-containing protein n=2 Tax=Palleronia caenipelagi TaxID=2489174 RepID=A0A547QB44_9RHOB|nr:hypothetical protein FEV53_00885 [Palleronia caenipelagi]
MHRVISLLVASQILLTSALAVALVAPGGIALCAGGQVVIVSDSHNPDEPSHASPCAVMASLWVPVTDRAEPHSLAVAPIAYTPDFHATSVPAVISATWPRGPPL